jgi:hypothetical protein
MAGLMNYRSILRRYQERENQMEKRPQATIVRLPAELHRQMRIAAFRRRTTLQKVMVEAAAKWLREMKEESTEKERAA